MAKILIDERSRADSKIQELTYDFQRRIQATPPGACPIAVSASLLDASAAQTCGKCTPCREGIPKIQELMAAIIACEATPDTLKQLEKRATLLQQTADCAVGYNAGAMVLKSLQDFGEEYESHIQRGVCEDTVGQTVPCVTECPAHVNIPAYIALVQEGDCAGAIAMIRKDNPFPTACALVCEHPCEVHCRRSIIDAPLNIRAVKKFAVDTVKATDVPTPQSAPSTGKRVAIIGAGPSGLTCAYYLGLMGHEVKVFEGRKQLGGMMRYGIPPYRLPRQRLQEDIDAILGIEGVTVATEQNIDTAAMEQIAKDFDAVYVAIGAQGAKSLDIPGAESPGVISAVDLLQKLGDDETPNFSGKNAVVIGGGNVAMDCARTAVRAGAETVTVAYRRRLEDMTALPEEVEAAIAEGVEMLTLAAPVAIELGPDGQPVALKVQPQRVGPVRGGRVAPVNADKPEETIPADIVLVAVGQDILSTPFEEFGLAANRSRFEADGYLQATNMPNVFVGGDCQTGPKTVIMAIAAGKVAARNIDHFLGFHHEIDHGAKSPAPRANDRQAYGRLNVEERPARERKNDFEGVEKPLSREEISQECGRCLRCDHFGAGALNERGLIPW